MIRKASTNEYELAFALADCFIATQYGHWASDDKVGPLVFNLLTDSDKCFFIYDDFAFLAGMKVPFLLGNKDMAIEIGWWVDPNRRGEGAGQQLMDAFERWAVDHNCDLITMVSIDDKVGEYYEKRGYKLYERTYMKEL